MTSHPVADQAFSISTKIKDTQSTDDDDEDDEQHQAPEEVHECQVLCCKTPWTAAGSASGAAGGEIHVVKVTQAGIATERCISGAHEKISSPPQHEQLEGKAVPAPEETESSLSLESVKLNIIT